MLKAVRYNLRNVFVSRGRDGRGTFLRYLMFVVLLNVVILALAALPPLVAIVGEVSANAGNVPANSLEARIIREMAETGLAQTLVQVSIGLGVLNIVLLVGALTRRAHDSGLPGIVVGVPLAIQLIWMYFAYTQLGGIRDTLQSAAAIREAGEVASVKAGMIAQDMLGWIVVLVVVLIGFARSQTGTNRYGDGPVKL